MADADDWNGLDQDEIIPEAEQQRAAAQEIEDEVQKLMSGLVKNNPSAMEYLHNRFVTAAIAVPGDDMLQIGLKQGQANMIKWIFNKAERNEKP